MFQEIPEELKQWARNMEIKLASEIGMPAALTAAEICDFLAQHLPEAQEAIGVATHAWPGVLAEMSSEALSTIKGDTLMMGLDSGHVCMILQDLPYQPEDSSRPFAITFWQLRSKEESDSEPDAFDLDLGGHE